jgi:hypothetical protein
MSIASPKPAPVRRRRSTLTGLDFVLIAASLAVFAVNAATHLAPTRTENPPDRTLHSADGQALLKARISLARLNGA